MPLYDLFEEVKNSYDIVEVVSNYVKLKRVGRNFVGLCPFHSEKTPSFVVSPEKQIFKCFGCGVAGDVVTFYMKIKGISFKEALIELAERAGIPVDNKVFVEKKKENQLVELNYRVAKFYHHLLYVHNSSEKARNYLIERGLSEETIKTFLLGFAPSEGRVLSGYLRSSKEDFKKAEETGLIKQTSDGSYIDLFRDRLIFPIFNLRGECVGFGGRALEKEVEPKYLNTPESKVYKKSEILYGLYHSKEFIKKESLGFLVEGYFDFLTLWDKGIKNVVATCGTALTEKHVKILKKLSENWIIFYDGDLAGKKATLRAISLFLKENILPKCVVLPEEEDPDSWVKKSDLRDKELMKGIQELTIDAISFVLDFYKEDYKLNPSRTFKEIVEIFREIEDPVLKKKVVKELSFQLDLPENEILKSFLRKGTFEKKEEESPELSETSESREDTPLKIIAQYLVNYPEDLPILEDAGLLKLLEYSEGSRYVNFLKYLIEELKKENPRIDYVPDLEFQEILSDLLLNPPFEEREEVLSQIKNYIFREITRRELKKIAESLKILQEQGAKEEIEKHLWLLKNSFGNKLNYINR